MEEFDSEVEQGGVAQGLVVLEDVKVPFVEIVDDLDHVVPHSGVDVDQLLESFLLLDELVLVDFFVFAVDFL